MAGPGKRKTGWETRIKQGHVFCSSEGKAELLAGEPRASQTRCWENALGPTGAELFYFIPFAQTREQRAVTVQSDFAAPAKTKRVFIPCTAPRKDS